MFIDRAIIDVKAGTGRAVKAGDTVTLRARLVVVPAATLAATPRPGTRSADAANHGTASVMLPIRANNFEWGYANGSILQAGGGRESQMERSLDFFELSTGSWAQGVDLGVRRRYPATVLLPDGKVMIVSGYDATYANPTIRNAHYLDPRPPASLATGTAASGETRGYHNHADPWKEERYA